MLIGIVRQRHIAIFSVALEEKLNVKNSDVEMFRFFFFVFCLFVYVFFCFTELLDLIVPPISTPSLLGDCCVVLRLRDTTTVTAINTRHSATTMPSGTRIIQSCSSFDDSSETVVVPSVDEVEVKRAVGLFLLVD